MAGPERQTEKKPFHEVVAPYIKKLNAGNFNGIMIIAELLAMTKIPKGHAEIAEALREYFRGQAVPNSVRKVIEDLQREAEEAQQKEAAAEAVPGDTR